jgi:ABC-2 type transport system permease protein
VPERRLATAYRGMLRASMMTALAYRGRVAIWILTSLFPLVMMVVWLNVVDEQGPAGGFGRADFVSYYVAASLVFQVTQSYLTWVWDDDLRSGAMSFRLLRPVAVFHQFLAQELGMRVVTLTVLLPVVVVLAVTLDDVRYPGIPSNLGLVALSVVLAFLLSCTMAMAFALIGFWSTQCANLYSLWWGAGAFLSGWIAPIAVLPDALQTAAEVLPFRGTVGFPIELALGLLDGRQIATGFAVTLAWLTAFGVIYRLGWPAAVRRYQAVSG